MSGSSLPKGARPWKGRGLDRLGLDWPGFARLAPAFGAGAAASLGLAPFGLWPLGLAGLAYWLARVNRGPSPLWQAYAGALGYFGLGLSWLISPFLVEPWLWGWAALPALALMAGGLSLFWLGGVWLGRRSRWPLAGMVVWIALAEMGRGYLFTGFPWAAPGHIWISSAFGQTAALFGPSGLTAVTLALAALLAAHGRGALVAVLAILAAGMGFGQWRLDQPLPPDRPVTLRLVQPNAEQGLKWDPDQARVFYDRLISMTAVKPPADLVIWPETALPYVLDDDPDLARLIGEAGGGAVVGFGRQRMKASRGWNSLTFLAPDGRTLAEYDKFHLVPFGEYVPFGDLAHTALGLEAFSAELGMVYTAGAGPRVIDLGGDLGRVQPLICYEAIFPQDLRGAGPRADWLLQITNDAWFGTLTGPWQHADQARLRSIEQGLPLVRVANTGITAVYDARGQITAELPFGTMSYLDAPLPGALPPTPYSRLGDLPIFLLLAGLGLGLLQLRHKNAA